MIKIIDNHEDDENQDGQGGDEGKGGQSGEIHYRYRDAASLEPRDDALPPNEIKRLLIVQNDLHKTLVEKQKTARKERQALKEGRLHQMPSYQQRMGGIGSNASKYKRHPISSKAQFSGIDKQMNQLPNDLVAETNSEMREKLDNRYTHRHVPQFNPKPRPRGG